jgi:formate dehydrogenase (coenzyme F420) beta subunit
MFKEENVPGLLKISNGDISGAISSFLSDLLEKGKITSLLVPQETPSGDMVFPALVSDAEKMKAAVLAPVLPVATARMVSNLTKDGSPSSRVGVVMRNCQLRALIELVKLKQANLENILLIGIDCPGTFSINDYRQLRKDKSDSELFKAILNNEAATLEKIRTSCRTCKAPFPVKCDIAIGICGMDTGKGILIDALTDAGKECLSGIELIEAGDLSKREKALDDILQERIAADKEFREEHSKIKGIEKITEFYAACMNCKNCREVCPICYCQECFFNSGNLSQDANGMVSRSVARGAFKMPRDTILFHTGRMNHMILSCVECGLCEQACPVNIPLMQIIKRAAKDSQEKFEYSPGNSLDDELPLAYFREDEFTEVGVE